MALDLNVVVLNGRLTKDAESKQVGDNTVTEFSLAFTSLEKGEEYSNFIDCSLWGSAGVVPYLVRGKQVSITGRLRHERWEKNGEKRSTYRVNVLNLQLMGGKESAGTPVGSSAQDEDIPFAPSYV